MGRKIVDAIILVCIFSNILPILFNCMYILPVVDDFTNGAAMKALLSEGYGYVEASIVRTVDLYINTSGYFFSGFINMVFSPQVRFGYVGVRLFCLLSYAFLFVVLYYLTKNLLNWSGIVSRRLILVTYLLLILCFTDVYQSGANYWYCFSVAYLVPVALGILGTVFFGKALKYNNKIWIILAGIIGFLGSGSSLNITSLVCSFYLLMGLYGYFVLKKKKIAIIGFCSALSGGIINLLSPGNYTRHDMVTNSYSILDAIEFSVEVVFGRVYELMTSTVLPFLLVAVFLLFLFSTEKIIDHKRIPIFFIIICGCISLLLIAFPVALGYGGLYYHERCKYVQDVAMNIYLFIVVIYAADYMRQKLSISQIRNHPGIFFCTILPIMLSFLMWHDGKSITEAHPLLGIAYNIVSGENNKAANYWESVLDEIEDSSDSNITVERQRLESSACLYLPEIGDNADYWMNVDVANYYGKERVTLIYTE